MLHGSPQKEVIQTAPTLQELPVREEIMTEDVLQPGLHTAQPLLRESRKASWRRGMLELRGQMGRGKAFQAKAKAQRCGGMWLG